MLKRRYYICDLFGIPIYLDISFAFILLMFATSGGSLALGLTAALVLAISVVLHELGHSLTAQAFGYRTNDITISLLGGCASLIALPRKNYQEFLTAIAGPAVSFVLAAIGYFSFDIFPIRSHYLAFVLSYLYGLNLMLGAFNLLPGFPMDGGRVFRSFMRAFMSKAKATFIAMWVGRVFAVLLALKGLHSIFSGGGWGFVTCLIAWMIWREGYREYLQARQEEDFRRWTQADFDARVSPPPYA